VSGINFEALDATITYAVEHPDEFDMSTWYLRRPGCGTTACLAGTVVALEGGWTPVWRRCGVNEEAYYVKRQGEPQQRVSDVAADLLGFDAEYDRTIFHAGTGINEVIEIRNEWARAAGIPERTWGEQP
jgi:hypothetical protein